MVCVLVAVLKYERVGIEVKSETSKPSERAKTVAKRFLQGGKAIESQHPPSMAFPFVCVDVDVCVCPGAAAGPAADMDVSATGRNVSANVALRKIQICEPPV